MHLQLRIVCSNLIAKLSDDQGQDLVEYALVVALIAFAAIAGMGTLAKDINNAFIAIGNTLQSSV